jgi:phosphoserine phosphatase
VSLAEGWPGAEIVFFDCDSTLAAIEGIDELAARRGVDVAALTCAAMAGEIPLDEVFRERLERIAPRLDDLEDLSDLYFAQRIADAEKVVAALHHLSIPCHVISGGLLPGVAPFSRRLGIPDHQVHAVPFPLAETDLKQAIDIACAHPLARDGGKPRIIEKVCTSRGIDPQRAMLVGDGASDLEAAPAIGLFVGFGGVVTRAKVKEEAQMFLPGPELAPVALLAAGPSKATRLEEFDPQLVAVARHQLSLVP